MNYVSILFDVFCKCSLSPVFLIPFRMANVSMWASSWDNKTIDTVFYCIIGNLAEILGILGLMKLY